MILPELGGRIHMAYDKVKATPLRVLQPSGEARARRVDRPVDFGRYRVQLAATPPPSTFLPTDFSIEEHADGSKTVWCNEVERMFRTKGMQGFTLYPGKAYIEINVKIYNRTSFPRRSCGGQTRPWWSTTTTIQCSRPM